MMTIDTRPAPDAVFNQVPALVERNLFTGDRALVDAFARETGGSDAAVLESIGSGLTDPALPELARMANRHPPTWNSFDAQGRRVDRIDFHPAWHGLMQGIVALGFHASPWAPDPPSFAHARRAAGYFMQGRIEQGTQCPTTMTYGGIAALAKDAWANEHWVPTILSRTYDPRDLPLDQKSGALVGMGMTEKQGGSDVRANTTRAIATDDGHRLTGHKWFFSCPQVDAHLVLAQSADRGGHDEGLSCFLVPRHAPDGTKNRVFVQRLKDKVGNRSNASAEVEFHDAWGRMIGAPGRGIPTILEMGTFTRLDCVIGTAGMMRECVAQAIHHATHRTAFGRSLVEQPLMTSVLADLALESEAATALALRLARAFDGDDENEVAFRRVMTAASKYWVCKRGPALAAEAMEVLGGNGYVEEGPIARLYREMPVNSIWEGSGNVMCLDVLRAFSRAPATRDALVASLASRRGSNAAYDRAFEAFAASGNAIDESEARIVVRRLVTLVQASLLLASGNDAVAEGFCETRLDAGTWGACFGELGSRCDARAIVDRAAPIPV
jgi:putative acyl-CoA dehydrogenase